MKKYFTVMVGSRGEVESIEIVECESIKGEIERRKDELIKGLKGDESMSESDIKDYVDEWWFVGECDFGCEVGLSEEESCVYIDMESEMFKKWGGDVSSMDREVFKLLNEFWAGL